MSSKGEPSEFYLDISVFSMLSEFSSILFTKVEYYFNLYKLFTLEIKILNFDSSQQLKTVAFSRNMYIKNITIQKTPSGRYYASLCCEVKYEESKYKHENQMSAIGLDWSPKSLFVSDIGKTGYDYGYIPFKQTNAKKLHLLQKRIMKKQKNSKNRFKGSLKSNCSTIF